MAGFAPKAAPERPRIMAALRSLRSKGYIARSNFLCCGNCGASAIAKMAAERGIAVDDVKMVFWHAQSEDYAFPRISRKKVQEYLYGTLYLMWCGDGHEIVAALQAQGLDVEWNGSEARGIGIKPQAYPQAYPVPEGSS